MRSMPSTIPVPARRMFTSTTFFPSSIGARMPRERRFDLLIDQGQIARHLVGQQRADLAQQLAE